jgi:hypothetical protein
LFILIRILFYVLFRFDSAFSAVGDELTDFDKQNPPLEQQPKQKPGISWIKNVENVRKYFRFIVVVHKNSVDMASPCPPPPAD